MAQNTRPVRFFFVLDKVNCAAREDALGRKEKGNIWF
jgi:hypothetical protein